MSTSDTPDDDAQAAELVGGSVSTLFGQPVVMGATHHTQSITPVRTDAGPVVPIRKRRTKGWWKRSPPD